MAKSARQAVFEGLELLPPALIPFVEKRLENSLQGHWQVQVVEKLPGLKPDKKGQIKWDLASLLNIMDRFWTDAFKTVLGRAERSWVNELVAVRNRLAHNETFSYDDAERALDSMRRLSEAAGAGTAAEELSKMRDTILRTKFEAQQRNQERRKPQRQDNKTDKVSGLLSWRQVVEPHADVAEGDYQVAEFAADLDKVHKGSASVEYSDSRDFFSRTYLTNGLSALLCNAAKRLSGSGGDPVVELQTNFGGGKTHSMLALYHAAGETAAEDLPGLDQLLADNKLALPREVKRAVLVGTARGPSEPFVAAKGLNIHTTWGELAWQLGGSAAFEMVADNDAKGVAPGSGLLEAMFKKTAPNLILIDEWVAYLRSIYKMDGLPSGSFDTNLSFVQALTEAVKTSPQTLLVASLPASQIEVGGDGGQEALMRLKQTFGRVESSWQPASQEESYEIVRRRLFKEIPGDKYMHKDNTLKQFAKMYRENPNDFPSGCSDEDYRRKFDKSYPIHPALFDHLFTAWGSLEKFQRTRGVLRLMAKVIHEHWMKQDSSVMIMPGGMDLDAAGIATELRRYLDDAWQSIIAGDIDGQGSTPYRIDESAPNLSRYSATRRVARTIFLGTAPMQGQENPGLDDKQINLGVVQPGEKTAAFGDALRRLSNQAKFMHSHQGRYWYSMSPSLNRMAADRAGQLEDALVTAEIDKALNAYIGSITDRGHLEGVQVAPESSADVPDEMNGVRMVVLSTGHPHRRNGADSEAMTEVKDILMRRGNASRVYRNTLVFLAADDRLMSNLHDAMRASLSWDSIMRDGNGGVLDLKASDVNFAKQQAHAALDTMQTRLKETWCYLLYPHQESPQEEMGYTASRIPAQDGVLSRASKKLVGDEALLPEIGPARLGRELDKYLWNEKQYLHLKDLWEYLNRYTYLPRLKNRETLIKTVQAAVGGIVPGPFAYAEQWDNEAGSYAGLLIDNSSAPITIDSESVLVQPVEAEKHRPKPTAAPGTGEEEDTRGGDSPGTGTDSEQESTEDDAAEQKPNRFIGTVMLPADRPARAMRQVVEGIVAQLTTLPEADVSLKLEIDAEVPSGLDQSKVRTLLENADTLKFIDKSVKHDKSV